MPKFIVILEDDLSRLAEMRMSLDEVLPQYEHIFFDDAFLLTAWLKEHLTEIVLISLDHDLPVKPDHGTGRDIADYLRDIAPICPVIVHTSNEYFAPGMMRVLTDGGWPCARVYPHSDHNWVRKGWVEQIRKFVRDGWIFT